MFICVPEPQVPEAGQWGRLLTVRHFLWAARPKVHTSSHQELQVFSGQPAPGRPVTCCSGHSLLMQLQVKRRGAEGGGGAGAGLLEGRDSKETG